MTAGESQSSGVATLSTGSRVFGRYQIIRCISSGGMGAVYEVIHVETRRRCALKVMLPSILSNPDLRARFQLEATVTADIQSEHIVELFDAGVDAESGAPFIVMELLRGEDLQSMVFRRGPLPPAEVTVLLFQAAMALDRTHAAGIVHRDLKPENLFITLRDDGSPRLKIFDFGIAKVVASSAHVSKSTQGMGTPMYMSPEQRGGDGSIGPPADTYALGHIAYTLLTGEGYWEEEAEGSPTVYAFLMKMSAGLAEPPSARAMRRRDLALPPAFDAWLTKATAPRPEDRFQRASEMVAELARALDQPVPTITSPSISIQVQPPSQVDVSPHAATVATEPGAKVDLGAPGAPTAKQPYGLIAAIAGIAVGLVIAGAGVLIYMRMPAPIVAPTRPPPPAEPLAEPPERAPKPTSAVAPPSVTPEPVAPGAPGPTGEPSATAPPRSSVAATVPAIARPSAKSTEKTPADSPSGKAKTPPPDPLDVR